MQVTTDERILIPGQDDWFYFKLYGYSKRKNELIAYLYDKLENLITSHKVKQYFLSVILIRNSIYEFECVRKRHEIYRF